jgi:long-chain fatty acid transport protein
MSLPISASRVNVRSKDPNQLRKAKICEAVVVALGVALTPAAAWSSSFQLLEQSGSNLGTAFAGTGTAQNDVSSIFFNPATLSTLTSPQVAVNLSLVDINTRFHDRGSSPALGQPLSAGSVDGGNAGGLNYVPSLYLGAPVNDRISVGFAINAPFGLRTDYDAGWIGRYQALKSDIKTYNFNPAIAFKLGSYFTFAVGADYQRLQAELGSAVNYSAVVAQGVQQLVLAGQVPPAAVPGLIAANAGLEGRTRVRGDDAAWGYNAGLLFEIPGSTRIGLSYRSAILYHIDGSVQFSAPQASQATGAAIIGGAALPGGPLAGGPVGLKLKLPDTAILSIAQPVSSSVELLADVAWTGWDSIQALNITRPNGVVVSSTPERWDNTWRASLGASWQMNPQWKFRGGVAWDQSPVPDSTRTPRLPDQDRKWIAIGTQWQPTETLAIDFGYAHLFVKDAALNQSEGNPQLSALLLGDQSSKINIASLQATYRF